ELAAELRVGRVLVKDESARLGLSAFKVLGASWGVLRALSASLGDEPAAVDLAGLRTRLRYGRSPRLVAATDGNHGRAVARMAALLGLSADIFVPSGLSSQAVSAITGEGATVTTVDGSYDDAVRQAADATRATGAVLVQDSGWPGYEEVPGWIAEGYATLFAELDEQLVEAGAAGVGLVAVPVGVGALAQAAVAHYRGTHAKTAPALLAVEPAVAACVLASLARGRLTSVPTGATVMAGLNCGTPSGVAWPYLRDGV
ncbi:MAG: pyridoxal-phosphate dependent enzyme, partial [Pseudonocardiaceae bacterium]|nr:pyridoxal-phosphate dependent enzyme [Pseudonocardiaceae bacterium]